MATAPLVQGRDLPDRRRAARADTRVSRRIHESIHGARDGPGEQRALEHDRRGYVLSRELQGELGDDYQVKYSPYTGAERDPQLPRQVSLHRLTGANLDELPELRQEIR